MRTCGSDRFDLQTCIQERVYKKVCDTYVKFDDYGLVELNCITIGIFMSAYLLQLMMSVYL